MAVVLQILRRIAADGCRPAADLPKLCTPSVARSYYKPPYLIKVGIPDFLNAVGNGVEAHAAKLEAEIGDLNKLLVTRTLRLKKLGIPCKHVRLHSKAGESIWYLDSGCSRHKIEDKSKFATLKSRDGGQVMLVIIRKVGIPEFLNALGNRMDAHAAMLEADMGDFNNFLSQEPFGSRSSTSLANTRFLCSA